VKLGDEFAEIGHAGGKVTITLRRDSRGRVSYSTGFRGSRPNPLAMIAFYALSDGTPVAFAELRGLFQPMDRPPRPDCLMVLVASDSTGYFGHLCPRCRGYWRSEGRPRFCPYCRLEAEAHVFLSKAQRHFIVEYCRAFAEALEAIQGGSQRLARRGHRPRRSVRRPLRRELSREIDLNAVADAVGKEDKPAFYVAEQSQQLKFKCAACGSFNDVLGKFVYCSNCATRNDHQLLKERVEAIREQMLNGGTAEAALMGAVSAFDSYVAQFARELARHVPMTEGRRNSLTSYSFHKIGDAAAKFDRCFDIDLVQSVPEIDVKFAQILFYRRHVHEHNGGEVDARYIENSGDTTVRLKQHIREKPEDIHRLVGVLLRLASNLHRGFHSIIPVAYKPIEAFEAQHRRLQARRL